MESAANATASSGPDWTRVGAALLAIGVACAAFSAHGLEKLVDADLVHVFETGVRQHLVHAVGLLVLGQLPSPPRACGWLVLMGIVLFSGSLYTLALSGQRWLGAITPLGGLSFIVGWSLLAIRGYRR